jgi:hypothetical protein
MSNVTYFEMTSPGFLDPIYCPVCCGKLTLNTRQSYFECRDHFAFRNDQAPGFVALWYDDFIIEHASSSRFITNLGYNDHIDIHQIKKNESGDLRYRKLESLSAYVADINSVNGLIECAGNLMITLRKYLHNIVLE